jgi:hypothetical protein
MTPSNDTGPEQETAGLVRPYVITNGRELLDDAEFSLITLVTVSTGTTRTGHLDPEKQGLVDLCSGGYLSVAEIVGHTRLPVGVVKILLSDLTEGGYLMTRAPVPPAKQIDRNILEEVLNGLQARFG